MADPTPADRSRPQPLPPVPLLDRARPGASLPAPLTSFVGREREVAAVAALLRREDVRLLTLTGPGGVGKTRLAQRLAGDLAGDFPDGVALVQLAPVSEPDLVTSAMAQALGVREAGGRPLREVLEAFLRGRRLLLVLDNFEQVVGAAPAVTALLAVCPGLNALVTSRVALRVLGEQEFPVLPLSLPGRGVEEQDALWGSRDAGGPRPDFSPARLIDSSEAVALFVQRARAVRPDFALTAETAPTVAQICRRLDGLPLAIELAAARSKVLSPAALAARLTNRLELLTSGPRDQPERLQTMRAAIAWSHDLLTPAEQALFRRLSVFAGGCTLEAAEAVAQEGDALDGLASLVDKSLLREVGGPDGEPRFGMLETVREFGVERLDASGETDALRGAHAAWCLELAEQAGSILARSDAATWLDRLDLEHPNLRAALAWATEFDATAGVRLAGALWPFWFARGYLAEGRGWLERALDRARDVPAAAAARPNALYGAGLLAWAQGDYPRAIALHEEGVAISRALGDDLGLAAALFGLGDVARRRGADDEAVTRFEEALALFREVGAPWWIAMSLNALGFVAGRRGDHERATAVLEEALLLFRRIGSEWGSAEALGYAGWVARDAGDGARAVALLREAAALSRKHGDSRAVAQWLYLLATVAVADGHADRAARLLGTVEALREPTGAVLLSPGGADYQQTVANLRAALGEGAFAAARAAGRVLTIEQALDDAAGATAPAVVAPSPSPDLSAGLTPREREVLRLLVEGRTDRQIAEALFISPRTAQGHVARIFGKLGVGTRAAAVAVALRAGLVADQATPR
jgi:non-specific serine/threonine protein kinase